MNIYEIHSFNHVMQQWETVYTTNIRDEASSMFLILNDLSRRSVANGFDSVQIHYRIWVRFERHFHQEAGVAVDWINDGF